MVNGGAVAAAFYPERNTAREALADRLWSAGAFWAQRLLHRRMADPEPFAGEVARHAALLRDAPLAALVPGLRYRLRQAPLAEAHLAECFALYCVAMERAADRESAVSPIVLGGARALVAGGVVELADLNARRSALALAACAFALRSGAVHLLAAGAQRAGELADAVRAPFAVLGIDVMLVTPDLDGVTRRCAYASPVTCVASRDAGVDYLRDRIALGGRPRRVLGTLDRLSGDVPAAHGLLLRGMQCALVDEADQVMLDDARMPLAVSTEAATSGDRLIYEQALELARALREPEDFSLGAGHAELTPEGSERLAQLTQALGGTWAGRGRRDELIALALDALHFAQHDRDYRVVQGRIVFPPGSAEEDEAPDMAGHMLQSLVEVKEGCQLSGRRVVLAQMTVPRVLGRYLHLAGTCADARGLEGEFWRLHRLRTVRARADSRPLAWNAMLLPTAAAKRDAVVESVRAAAASGAVVIASRSPAESQALLQSCASAGIAAGVLRGTGDTAEQRAVAALDSPGTVIVTLYPAERTVRRAHSSAVPLHLIVAELHDAERHIAQIARVYGAGSCDVVLSLEDEALKAHLTARELNAAATAARSGDKPFRERHRRWVRRALRSAERAAARARGDIASLEGSLDDLLAFSGQRE